MTLFAQAHDGFSWGGPFEPWEIHPALNHLPIAFLLGGVALDLYAWMHGRQSLAPIVAGLLVAGLLTGLLTALAGVLSFFTVSGHTEEAHRLMYWHASLQAAALGLFVGPTWKRWRHRTATPSASNRLVTCLAAIVLLVGSSIGGYIVYHGGAGIDPQLLVPTLQQNHANIGHGTSASGVSDYSMGHR